MGTAGVSVAAKPAARQAAVSAGAYAAIVIFFFVYCARPEDWTYALYGFPLAKITGALAVVGLVMALGSGKRSLPREMFYFVLLVMQLWFTVPFSPVWRGGAFWSAADFSKLLLILPVMLITAATLRRLRGLIFVQAASAALVALFSILQHSSDTSGRMHGAAGGSYSNPNDLATALSIALPFCLAFALRKSPVWRKWPWIPSILIMAYAVFLTESRGGLLALVVSAGTSIWEFGVRGGRRYLVVIAAVVALGAGIAGGGGIKARFAGTFGEDLMSAGARTAYGSALERREMLRKSIELTLEHPLFGIGPNNFTSTTSHWRETHNNYTQLSAEGGIPALILFLMILWRSFVNLRETRQLAGKGSEEDLWASALKASLLGFMVGSFFSSVAYLFFPYFLMMYTSILRGVVSSPEGPGPEPVPEKPAPRVSRDLFRLGRASSVSGA
ncbi:MAG TPA: O-antigen ligase family protein [Terriglobia bacterium]|nr:O-antigen ligase family protein [Terriglobia bacterium]